MTGKSIVSQFEMRRRTMGLTQKQLAAMLGFTDKQISRYERGEQLPKPVVNLAMCHLENILTSSEPKLLRRALETIGNKAQQAINTGGREDYVPSEVLDGVLDALGVNWQPKQDGKAFDAPPP